MSLFGSFPLAPAFRLHSHQIAQVICQVRFSPVLRLEQPAEIIGFQEAVRERFPRYEQEHGMTVVVTPKGIAQPAEGPPVHRFGDREGRLALALAPNFFSIETRQYLKIDDLVEELTRGLEIIKELYDPPEITRVGLRFINELRLPQDRLEAELQEAVNSQLLGVLTDDSLASLLADGRSVSRFAMPSGPTVQLMNGLHRDGGTTVARMPALPDERDLRKPFFLVDIDVYEETPVSFDPAAAGELVRSYNDMVRTVFSWAVPEEYRREKLGQEDLD